MTRKSMAAALEEAAADVDIRAARGRLGEALPDDGWLGTFIKACVPLTDAPVEFHLASGMAALATGLGNRRWRPAWGITVYPALWVVLVAPSSFWRKSTSITLAERVVRDADPKAVMASDFSRERFLDLLKDRPDPLLVQKEFGGFLATLGRDYMGGMMETLTDLYDGPDVYTRSLKSGTIEIRSPSLTILAATTVDWLEKRITEDALSGGFLARFMFVTATAKASPKGLTGGMDQTVRNGLVKALHNLTDRPSQMVEIEKGAQELYDEWMAGWEAEVTGQRHRSDLTGFAVRLQTYALKFAMLYRASMTCMVEPFDVDADRAIDERSMRQAIAYCRHLWLNVVALIDEDIAISKEAKDLRRILGLVGKGITRSDALRRSKMKARDFDQFLDTLIQSGQLQKERVAAADAGLERSRNRDVDWLTVPHRNGSSPYSSADSPALTVPGNASGTGGNSNEGGQGRNYRELEGPDSLLDSLSSLSLTVPDARETSTRMRARGEPGTVGGAPLSEVDVASFFAGLDDAGGGVPT